MELEPACPSASLRLWQLIWDYLWLACAVDQRFSYIQTFILASISFVFSGLPFASLFLLCFFTPQNPPWFSPRYSEEEIDGRISLADLRGASLPYTTKVVNNSIRFMSFLSCHKIGFIKILWEGMQRWLNYWFCLIWSLAMHYLGTSFSSLIIIGISLPYRIRSVMCYNHIFAHDVMPFIITHCYAWLCCFGMKSVKLSRQGLIFFSSIGRKSIVAWIHVSNNPNQKRAIG